MAVEPDVSDRPYLSLVLPAYNEEQRLGASLRKLADHLGSQAYAWTRFDWPSATSEPPWLLIQLAMSALRATSALFCASLMPLTCMPPPFRKALGM